MQNAPPPKKRLQFASKNFNHVERKKQKTHMFFFVFFLCIQISNVVNPQSTQQNITRLL